MNSFNFKPRLMLGVSFLCIAQSVFAADTDGAVSGEALSKHPQYGFAHRVNDAGNIKDALEAGANGIEIDICYENLVRQEGWYVSHNDSLPSVSVPGLPFLRLPSLFGHLCANPTAERLEEWLAELKSQLDNNSTYKSQLAMLWLDIKDPGDSALGEAVATLHSAGLPSDLEINYDLTGFNSDSKLGFSRIYNELNSNEGISFCAGKSCGGDRSTIGDIYDFYKENGFKRGGFNHGDTLNIDDDFLKKANEVQFSLATDPYRFKHVFTWSNGLETSMMDYVNPQNLHQTDGQIVGLKLLNSWKGVDSNYITYFYNAVERYSGSERLAVPADNIFKAAVEIFDDTFYNLRNRWRSSECIIHVEDGDVSCTDGPTGWHSAQWTFERVADTKFYKIKNRWQSEKYIHVEHGSIESSALGDPSWHSAQWELEVVDEGAGFVRMKNRWNSCYIHVEHGGIECSDLGDSTWRSAQWKVSLDLTSIEKQHLPTQAGETKECLNTDEQTTITANHGVELKWQQDGNLVIYHRDISSAIWASDTQNQGTRLCFQSDGNLVIYSDSEAIWATGEGGQVLQIQNDCNLVLSRDGESLWNSGPTCTNSSGDSSGETPDLSGFDVELSVTDQWYRGDGILGYCISVDIHNNATESTTGWSVTADLHGAKIFDIWNLGHSVSNGQATLTDNASWNAIIPPGESRTQKSLGFCAYNDNAELPSLIRTQASF